MFEPINRAESLPLSQLSEGGTKDSKHRIIPNSASCRCPYCGKFASFTLRNATPSQPADVKLLLAVCPSCSVASHFTVYLSAESSRPVAVTRFPSPNVQIEPIVLPEVISEEIKKSIREAESCYDNENYIASIIVAGRSLEGLLKHQLKIDGMLGKLIQQLSKSDAISKPLESLTKALQGGRNSAAHFDEYFVPDEESARHTLMLLRHYIAYFFHFQNDAELLEKKLRPVGRADNSGQGNSER